MRITMRSVDGNRLQKNKLPDQILDQLMEWIMKGRLSMGDKLNADELAEEFGVSRMPVREALVNLEKIGLAKTVPYTGTTLVKLEKKDVQEIYIARSALEPIAAKYACIRMTDQQIAETEKIHNEYIATVRKDVLDPLDVYQLNRRFHFSIYQASDMKRICEVIENLWDNLAYFKFIYGQKLLANDGLKEKMIGEHQTYMNALKNRDGDLIYYEQKRNLEKRASDVAFFTDGYMCDEDQDSDKG